MRLFLLSLPLLLPHAAGAAELGVTQSFGDWIVGCDNARSCTAVGLSADDAAAFAYLTVAREGGPGTGPVVSVAILDELDAGGSIRLALPGGTLPIETLEPVDETASFAFAQLAPAEAAAFVETLLPQESLEISIGDELVPVSLAGMAAALRYMDAAQERAGTANALVARGERPEDTVPAAPDLPLIEAMALRSIDTPSERPDGLPTRDEFCPETGTDTVLEAENGTLIWGVCTSAGAYNLFETYSIVREGVATPADLGPQGAGIDPDDEGRSTLVNAGLGDDGRSLQAFFRGRGLGDCGSITTFVFDGEGLQLAQEAVMDECRGVQPDDWPVIFRAAID